MDAVEPRRTLPLPSGIEPLPSSKSIAKDVAQTLRRLLVTMQIPPGTRLSEQEVGRRLGVSRQPVREAFIKLAEVGLVVILPQRGTQVVHISPRAVGDALFIREAVECAVAREAARLLDLDCKKLITENLEQQKVALARSQPDRLFALDEDFHHLLAKAAGRPLAWTAIDHVKAHLDRVRWLSFAALGARSTVIEEHEAIFAAIQRGDQPAAAEAMRRHVTNQIGKVEQVMAERPDLFEADERGWEARVD
jgi:DNA-binding GntR family transcriptional regulator